MTWTLFVNHNSAQLGRTLADLDAGKTTPTGGFSISWGAPAGRTHPDAGSYSLTIRSADPRALALGDFLQVTLNHSDIGTVSLSRCWVESCGRDPRTGTGSGAWRYTFTPSLTDVYGRAAGIALSSTPWPVHTQPQRMAAINAAAGQRIAATEFPSDPGEPGVRLIPRDVDSVDALTVIRATITPRRAAFIGGQDTNQTPLLEPLDLPGDRLTVSGTSWNPYTIKPGSQVIVPIPADAIELSGADLSRSSYLTEARYQGTILNSDGTKGASETRVARNGSALPSSVWTLETDIGLTPGGVGVPYQISDTLSETKAASWVPRPARILLDRLPPADVLTLLDENTRPRVVLELMDAPPGMEWYQSMIGGQLTGDFQRPEQPLTLTAILEPARMSGARPMRWSDTLRPPHPMPMRFSLMQTMTFSDTRLITRYN